jgi:hypothetical protein
MSSKQREPIEADDRPDRSGDSRNARHHAELLEGLANTQPPSVQPAATAEEMIDAYTIEEFCRRHRISYPSFYKHRDLMPPTFTVGTRRLISREAAAKWRRKREQIEKAAAGAA